MTCEVKGKLVRVREYMRREGFSGVLLTTNPNFCWLSGGKSAFVDKGSESAVAKLLVTDDRQYVICNSSEMARIPEEELSCGEFELVKFWWHDSEEGALRPLIAGKHIASDSGAFGTENRAEELKKLRYQLTDEEVARYREIGSDVAAMVEQCCRDVSPGEREHEIAGRTAGALLSKGYRLPVCLIASDERLLRYRHPVPTDKRVEQIAMVAVCAQKYGLTVSLSRIVCFGSLDADRQRKYDALLKVDATFITSTVEGAVTGEIVRKAHESYTAGGYERDFHLHHQGGGLGYETRDYCANEQCREIVGHRQAFSWNPTIAGVKLEDTYLIDGNQQEIVTQTGTWPLCKIIVDGKSIQRPLILEL